MSPFLRRTLLWAAVPVVLALILVVVGLLLGDGEGVAPMQYAVF